jgi:hypothetical protein
MGTEHGTNQDHGCAERQADANEYQYWKVIFEHLVYGAQVI